MCKILRRKIAVILLGGALIILLGPGSASAGFPVKPIRIIIGSAAGGGDDTESRAIAVYLEKYLKVNVIIENQPGAAGKIAFEKFVHTKPDGHSLMASSFPKGPIIETMEKVNFSVKNYTPVYAWSRTNSLLVVHVDTWKTADEFIAAAKAKVLSGGLSGRGSTTHLQGLIATDSLKFRANWVPYEGASGSVMALAGKHLDFTICLAASAIPLIDAGKLRPLLLFGEERDLFLPNVPIPKDLGYKVPSLLAIRGVHAPPRTPAEIVRVLEEAFSKAVKDPGFIEWGKNRKMIPYNLTAQQFGKVVIETYPIVGQYKQLLKE